MTLQRLGVIVRAPRGLAFLLGAALLAPPVAAQTTYTWTGAGGDDNWNTAANWNNGVPASSNTTTLSFAGSTRTNPVNNLNAWNTIGRLEFAANAASFTLTGNPVGFNPYPVGQPYVNQNQIFQNSVNTQTIAIEAFSFRAQGDGNFQSNINLHGGDLVISSPNVYVDANQDFMPHALVITGENQFLAVDSTRRTVTLTGTLQQWGGGADTITELYIRDNKRLLVTGSGAVDLGSNGSITVNDGALEFAGSGSYVNGSVTLRANDPNQQAGIYLGTGGQSFVKDISIAANADPSVRQSVAGLNTSGTVSYSGRLSTYSSDLEYPGALDYMASTGGTVLFNGGYRDLGYEGLYVNRPDGATTYGGTVILANAAVNNYTDDGPAPGFTAIYGGTLQISNLNQLGEGHFEFNASSGDSGTLRYTGGSDWTDRTLWIDNPGITRAAIDVSGGSTLTWDPNGGDRNRNLTKAGAGTLVFEGTIGGGTVGVEGGLLILNQSNGYAGGTTVSNGTVEISGGFGQSGGSASGLGSGLVTVGAGGQVNYWLSSSSQHTIANPFALAGGTLYTIDGSNNFSGLMTLASGTSVIASKYEDTITVSGGLAGSGNVLFAQSGGTGAWNAPTFVLTGTGSNTGSVRVDGMSNGVATKLQLANVNALQNATLDMATGDVGTVEFTAAGTNTYSLGGLQGSRAVALGANSLAVGGNGSSTTYSGNLSTTGSLTKTGAGTLTLSGSNALAGGTTLNAGTLSLGSSGALGSGGTISFGGGTLQSTAGNTTDYSARFSNAASQAYKIDTNGQNVTLATSLTSVGGTLTKLGTGTLTLSGSHGYTGPTTVQAGTLSLSGTIASSAVTVQSGATLAGTGFLGSPLTIASSGTLAPGNSPGQITSSTLTLEAGSATVLEIVGVTSGTSSLAGAAGTNYDTLVVSTSGGLTYGGALSIAFSNVSPFANGTTFDLFQFTGAKSGVFASIATIGSGDYANLTFTSNPDGSWSTPQTAGQQYLKFDPVTGDLVIVPEPSTWAMVLAGAATVGLLRRRRRA